MSTEEEITQVRKDLKRFSKLSGRKRELRERLETLEKKRREEIRAYIAKSYALDLTSLSVKPLRLKTSRYLRANGRYWNNLNLLIAYRESRGYALFVEKTQITHGDLET
jgi:acetyl-CoA carboxylase alpha subunit